MGSRCPLWFSPVACSKNAPDPTNTMEEPDKQLEELLASWQTCKSQDEQKNAVIQALFTRVGDLKDNLKQMERSLKEERMLKDLYRRNLEDATSSNKSLVQAKERCSFALVLVDGDCMLFQDEFIKGGFDGGRRAAQSLKQGVKSQLDALADEGKDPRLQVVVRVYANLKGLAKVYKDTCTIFPDVPSASVDEFVRGFNMLDPLCDFIDAGNGKECADEKIKALFRLGLDDVHCRQILFGASADNGYARLLGQHVGDDAVCGRITLLQGPPFAHELALIKNRFRMATMDGVFRREKLSLHLTPPATPSSDYVGNAAPASAKPASSDVAAREKSPPQATAAAPPSGDTNQTPTSSNGDGSAAPLGKVRKNRHGQRVDLPIECSAKDLNRMKNRQLCHSFHLLGECSWMEKFGDCKNKHGERVYGPWVHTLQAVARLSCCNRGLNCADPKCLAGHSCPTPECPGPAKGCRFSRAMHNVDATPL
ncbi:hypothetical protein RB593_001329 [Gaeumannomyces tritici]